MTPVSALLVTLGRNSVDFALSTSSSSSSSGHFALQFPRDTRVKSAALLLIREKNNRYSLVRVRSSVETCLHWLRFCLILHYLPTFFYP